MQAANYVKHFKVLGKLARLWDDGGLDTASLKTLVSRLWDQVATGESPSYEACLLLNPFAASVDLAIQAGQTDTQRRANDMTEAYLKSSTFQNDLTTSPSNANDAKSVLEALQTDMGAGVDDVTLSDTAATGFVNFFDTNWSPAGAWNTEADATADYKDTTYVVTAIV